MAAKKKTAMGPKAKLMKKNLTQLKAQAKRLKIKGFSTKKKEALVKSIMLAEARKKKSKAPKKSMGERDYTPTGTRKSIKRMAKKRGAMPDRVMRNPVRPGVRNRPTMGQRDYYNEADFKGFGYPQLFEAGELLAFYAAEGGVFGTRKNPALTPIAQNYFYRDGDIKVGYNSNSGNVFLIDEDYNVLMMNDGKLDLFITTPYNGEEGFYDDLMDIYDELDEEDQDYLDSLK